MSTEPGSRRQPSMRWPRCRLTKRPNGWCWIGLHRSATRLSTKPFSGPLLRALTALAGMIRCCRPRSSSTRCATPTRACASRPVIPSLQLSRFMGHAKVTTTLAVYTHLFDDDHAETMAALGAMSRPDDAPPKLGAVDILTRSHDDLARDRIELERKRRPNFFAASYRQPPAAISALE